MQDNQDDEAEVELNKTTMAIFVTGKEHPAHPPKDIKIVIEETMVLNEVPSVDKAFAMFFGLMYALNLQYPKKHKHTFEFVQKVLMELDAKKLSPKVHKLRTELNSQE